MSFIYTTGAEFSSYKYRQLNILVVFNHFAEISKNEITVMSIFKSLPRFRDLSILGNLLCSSCSL
jgi:hypothetical protein